MPSRSRQQGWRKRQRGTAATSRPQLSRLAPRPQVRIEHAHPPPPIAQHAERQCQIILAQDLETVAERNLGIRLGGYVPAVVAQTPDQAVAARLQKQMRL